MLAVLMIAFGYANGIAWSWLPAAAAGCAVVVMMRRAGVTAVNIESTFQDVSTGHLTEQSYTPFPGLILTDTFQSWETDDRLDYEVFQENNQRLERLKRLPITVIVGNPPYSVGQESANDDNANESYRTLDRAIRESYAAKAAKASIRGLYDSYVRAIKWASLRIGDRGVIAYVTNGGFLDSASGDGMRKALAEDFSSIHIFNLRGNRRNAGAEGRPVFEAYAKSKGGSIAGIAIVVLVKNPGATGDCRIRYAQVADFMTAHQKLEAVVAAGSMLRTKSRAIVPNAAGDWLGQRREDFAAFIPLYEKGTMSVFGLTSKGLTTNRDAWIYGSSRDVLANNVERMIHTYTSSLNAAAEPTKDPRQISWSRRLLTRLSRRQDLAHKSSAYRLAMYRPYQQQQHVYFSADLNEDRRRLPLAFPTASTTNCGLLLTGVASHYAFAAIATASIPDLHLLDTGQFFSRWRYEEIEDEATLGLAFDDSEVVEGYRRVDNITDQALTTFRERYGDTISKDDIFHYTYGLLHSAEYRRTYADDLKKALPRLPMVPDPHPFINAGQAHFELHLGYESAEPFPLIGLDVDAEGNPYDFYRVEKMAFPKIRVDGKLVADKTKIRYNSRIELSGIPEEVQRYELGPRTAVEWLIERYQVRTDKDSGIVNDPNDWAREKANPRFVLDLVARIVTVSVETVKVVEALPALDILATN
jgi:predicted helicase